MDDKPYHQEQTAGKPEDANAGTQDPDRFRYLCKAAVEGLCIHDQGVLLEVSESFARMFGYDAGELIGHEGYFLFSPEVRQQVREQVKSHREDVYETQGQRKDGTIFPIEVHVKEILYHDRRVRVAAIRDITQHKEEERRRRVWEDRLRHMQTLESLGTLAGGLAHDFNNLLTVVLGQLGLAELRLPPDAEVQGHLKEIRSAAQRAANLTRQLLACSGKGRFILKSVDLAALVREMSPLLAVSVGQQVRLEYELLGGPPAVKADAAQLEQVVMHLVSNAAEAIGDQEGTIRLTVGRMAAGRGYLEECYPHDELPEGQYAYFEVSDTGHGMDAQTRARIFDPFFSTRATGRGLGLAAAVGIVRAHHGTLHVTSEPGRGTAIRVLLPAQPVAQAPVPNGTGGNGKHTPREGLVLLADDEPAVLEVTRKMLELGGMRVVTAGDGAEAVRLFNDRSLEVDLVILDMTMPEMTGEQALRAMRAMRPELPAVLISGFAPKCADVTGDTAVPILFLRKPYPLSALLDTVRSAMTR